MPAEESDTHMPANYRSESDDDSGAQGLAGSARGG